MNDPQRSKAAAMFGKTFMDAAKPTPPAKNYATAQQKVANSRPIPTYKVGGPVKKAMGGDARMFDEAVAAMPSPVMRAVGGAGKTRKGQAPIKRAMGGPVKDGSKKDAEYGDYVAGEKDRKPTKPVKKAMGGVGKMRHDVPMKGVKPHKGIGV